MKIEGENESSLEKSYNIIKNILFEYKLYKNIISESQNIIINNKDNKNTINKTIKEFSKEELIEMNKNNYNKNILNDIEHKINRIKKWVKMSKYSPKETQNINIPKDNDTKNNKLNKINNKFILSNYADIKIEKGLFLYYKNKPSKFFRRIKKGPPDCFRWCSWCIINFLPQERNNIIYENYTNMSLEKENKDRIIRDIERTFSHQKKNKNELRKMEKSLYKILKSFWNLDRDIGYCQGMNLIVGFILILSNFNERDSFFLLSSMFSNTFKSRKKYEYNIRGLFYEEFPLLNLLNYIFENLLEHNFSNLKRHLDKLGITIDLWMSRWFHTLFIIVLPINWCKRVWDNIFSENIFFLVKFGICFTQMIQDDILKMEEEEQILNYFKKYEKFSLCYDNEELNKKCDLNKIILKSQKINIDIEFFLKNYEKINSSFNQKLNEINDIKYKFNTQFIKKETHSTILFSDDDIINTKKDLENSLKNNSINIKKEEENEIDFGMINVEINNQNKKNKIPIKLKSSNSNSNKNNIITNKQNTSNSLHINEIKIFNDIKINSNEIKNEKKINEENNNIINEIENIKLDESSESINNDFEENIEFDQNNTDVIQKNISLYKFENFLNINRLDKHSNQKDENNKNLFFIGKNETIGLHRPNEEDISSFIGKNKFKNSKILFSEKK
jgi:hypothetical protein